MFYGPTFGHLILVQNKPPNYPGITCVLGKCATGKNHKGNNLYICPDSGEKKIRGSRTMVVEEHIKEV